MLIVAHINNLELEVIDVKMAFLYGMLDEEIYMKLPEGMKHFKQIRDDECLALWKTL